MGFVLSVGDLLTLNVIRTLDEVLWFVKQGRPSRPRELQQAFLRFRLTLQ
jgi:hypothetical protein